MECWLLSTCTRSGSAELLPDEAAVGIERLDGEEAMAAVAEDQQPPGLDAARVRELRSPAPQERAVAVPPDLDTPVLDRAAGRADDEGLLSADPLGELVWDALQSNRAARSDQFLELRRRRRKARRDGEIPRTRLSQVKGSSTLGCLIWAPSRPADEAMVGVAGDALGRMARLWVWDGIPPPAAAAVWN